MESEVFYLVQQGPFWDWRIALDLFLGGAGVGAFLFAVMCDEVYHGRYRRICTTAAWLSPLLLISGLVFLALKLGHPARLFQVYTNFNPTAPLWWGGIFQPLLIIGGIIYAFKWMNAPPVDRPRLWLGRLLGPVAIIVGAYHGLLLSMMNSRPLWNTGPTVVSAILAFIATGIAAVALVHLIRMKLTGGWQIEELEEHGESYNVFLDAMRRVRTVLFAVLAMQLATCILWFLALTYGSVEQREALAAANQQYGSMFWGLGIGVGLILPIGIIALAAFRPRPWPQAWRIGFVALTSVLILVGGYFFRLSIVLGGQVQPPITNVF